MDKDFVLLQFNKF